MDKNRERIAYIHIPKMGGTYLLNTLFNKNNLYAEHLKKKEMNVRNKHILVSVREPVSFYISFFNFFKNPNHKIQNRFVKIVKKYSNLDKFLIDILSNKAKFSSYTGLSPFDRMYVSSKNNHGLLTNYFIYFFSIEYKSRDDLHRSILNIKEQYHILYFESLANDLKTFCEAKNIQYNREKLQSRNINKNTKPYTNISDEVVNLIKKKDRIIYDVFYSAYI